MLEQQFTVEQPFIPPDDPVNRHLRLLRLESPKANRFPVGFRSIATARNVHRLVTLFPDGLIFFIHIQILRFVDIWLTTFRDSLQPRPSFNSWRRLGHFSLGTFIGDFTLGTSHWAFSFGLFYWPLFIGLFFRAFSMGNLQWALGTFYQELFIEHYLYIIFI